MINSKIIIPYSLALITSPISIIMDTDILKFSIFVILFIVYMIKRYDSRILIKFGLLFLIFSAIGLILKDEKISGQIVIYSYYYLVIGVASQLIEYIRYIKNTDNYEQEF